MARVKVFNIEADLDDDRSTHNVWADGRREAEGLLRERYAPEGVEVSVRRTTQVSDDTAGRFGTVLRIS